MRKESVTLRYAMQAVLLNLSLTRPLSHFKPVIPASDQTHSNAQPGLVTHSDYTRGNVRPSTVIQKIIKSGARHFHTSHISNTSHEAPIAGVGGGGTRYGYQVGG
ncbi:hypothetical protein CFAEC_03190 [Corynebacterium faecale]|nr:hypothetical protein CFAEC_03190 [Corynebacterium faecale]